MVSVTFQKSQASGELGVEILKNGSPAASQTTTAEYGLVSAATQ